MSLHYFPLLIYRRVLNPASKIATAAQNEDYYAPIVENPYSCNVYDTLDFMYQFRSRFIFVADRGMCATPNLLHLIDNNNGYIISKSVRKCSREDKKWILEDAGYIPDGSDFKHKSRIVKYQVSDPKEKGKT